MSRKLKAGDHVEVRSATEILNTLDENGCLDGMPFMPEMIPYIGRHYRVSKRAHKTCDTVHQTGGRRLYDTVHLEDLRCDGIGHDGCKATCLLFWKAAWLRPAACGRPEDPQEAAEDSSTNDLDSLARTGSRSGNSVGRDTIYRCQATALYDASEPLRWYDLRQYIEDVTSGNTTPGHMLKVWFFRGLYKIMATGIAYRAWEWLYNSIQTRVGGYKNPFRSGSVPAGNKTPELALDLEPGESVRVRSHDDILATLTLDNKNRGMRFDPEMVPFCGKTYTVQRRVDRIIHETTGRMIEMKTPSVILDGVVCRSEMSQCRLFCPRAIPSYWREIWLERVDGDGANSISGR